MAQNSDHLDTIAVAVIVVPLYCLAPFKGRIHQDDDDEKKIGSANVAIAVVVHQSFGAIC